MVERASFRLVDVLIEASENMDITAVSLPTAVKPVTRNTPNPGIPRSSGLSNQTVCLSENGKRVAPSTLICTYDGRIQGYTLAILYHQPLGQVPPFCLSRLPWLCTSQEKTYALDPVLL